MGVESLQGLSSPARNKTAHVPDLYNEVATIATKDVGIGKQRQNEGSSSVLR